MKIGPSVFNGGATIHRIHGSVCPNSGAVALHELDLNSKCLGHGAPQTKQAAQRPAVRDEHTYRYIANV